MQAVTANKDLKLRFIALLAGCDSGLTERFWREIETAYSSKSRVYHNLEHLTNLLAELDTVQDLVEDMETILWSVFYHDVIYNVRRQDNEEQSAELAVERMTSLNIPEERVKRCKDQIVATKSHDIASENDTNLFTDADLAVLGKDWDTYQTYFKAIRKEYRIYPNLLYKPARKKVLKHFLTMPFIFKTAHFRNLYEEQARKNLNREIELL